MSHGPRGVGRPRAAPIASQITEPSSPEAARCWEAGGAHPGGAGVLPSRLVVNACMNLAEGACRMPHWARIPSQLRSPVPSGSFAPTGFTSLLSSPAPGAAGQMLSCARNHAPCALFRARAGGGPPFAPSSKESFGCHMPLLPEIEPKPSGAAATVLWSLTRARIRGSFLAECNPARERRCWADGAFVLGWPQGAYTRRT